MFGIDPSFYSKGIRIKTQRYKTVYKQQKIYNSSVMTFLAAVYSRKFKKNFDCEERVKLAIK